MIVKRIFCTHGLKLCAPISSKTSTGTSLMRFDQGMLRYRHCYVSAAVVESRNSGTTMNSTSTPLANNSFAIAAEPKKFCRYRPLPSKISPGRLIPLAKELANAMAAERALTGNLSVTISIRSFNILRIEFQIKIAK